jgi:hypothetical protein
MKAPSTAIRIIVGFTGLLLLLGVLRRCSRAEAPPSAPATVSVTGRFAGFTNNLGKVEALFEIRAVGDVEMAMSFGERYVPGDANLTTIRCGTPSWFQYEPWGRTYAVSVDSTNEQVRAVFDVYTRSVGGTRAWESILELYGKWFGCARQIYSGERLQVLIDSGNPEEATAD